MSKFYLIEISTGADAIKGKAIYEYATEREATAAYHQKMATAMKSDLFETELVMVVDAYGNYLTRDLFEKSAGAAEEERE